MREIYMCGYRILVNIMKTWQRSVFVLNFLCYKYLILQVSKQDNTSLHETQHGGMVVDVQNTTTIDFLKIVILARTSTGYIRYQNNWKNKP